MTTFPHLGRPTSFLRPLCVLCASAAIFSPPAAADPGAKAAALAALKAVESQPGYAARYDARIARSGSDPFEQSGAAVRAGALFYREGRRRGETEPGIRFYRQSGKLAVWDLRSEQWLKGEQAGDPTLGKGLEDPDTAMAFLQTAVTDATKGGTETLGGTACDVYAIALDREALAAKVKEQSQAGDDLDWAKSEVNAQVLIGGAPALPRKFRINGVLPVKGEAAGHVNLHIEIDVDLYGEQPLAGKIPKEAKEILGIP
jgi:hypothetical protein